MLISRTQGGRQATEDYRFVGSRLLQEHPREIIGCGGERLKVVLVEPTGLLYLACP